MKKIICNRCGADITEGTKYHLVMTVNASDKANAKFDICPDCWEDDVEPVLTGTDQEDQEDG